MLPSVLGPFEILDLDRITSLASALFSQGLSLALIAKRP